MKIIKDYSGNPNDFIDHKGNELLDFSCGCLLDNYLIVTKRGYIALFETYVNCWTSNYTLYFSEDANEINNLWSERIYAN